MSDHDLNEQSGGQGENGAKSLTALIDAPDTRGREGGDEPTRRPYRQVPRDFEALWPATGWSAAELVWRAHSRTISRWLDECGRDRMILARKAYLAAERTIAGRARRKRYVLGKTLAGPAKKTAELPSPLIPN